MTDSQLALFKGTSPDECEAFVATVRLRALEQGKHRDNEWMAIFASGYLRGEAFHWYEDLEESVQNDWSQLRPALLARFGVRVETPTDTSTARVVPGSTPTATIPTPAAAPPVSPAPTAAPPVSPTPATAPPATAPSSFVRKGRLKVLKSSGALRGYIKKSADGGVHASLNKNRSDALLVSFTPPADGLFAIQIDDASKNTQATDELAVTWKNRTGGEWMTYPYGLAVCCSLSAIMRTTWPVERKVWGISTDGELWVEYPKPDGVSVRLQPWVNQNNKTLWWEKASVGCMQYAKVIFDDVI